MASDHLIIRIEHLSHFGLKEQGLLLYSPSTVQTLKEELAHCHSVPPLEIMVYHDGALLGDKERIVDKRMYQVRMPMPLNKSMVAQEKMLGTVQKSVTFGEGVHVDGAVEITQGPPIVERVYVAFGSVNTVYLVDAIYGAVLTPRPGLRLGHCVVYADWDSLQGMLRTVPGAEPMMWLYDRLRRDYGILGTSSVFNIHTAPLAQLHRYQKVAKAWLERRGSVRIEQADETEEEEEEEETGEEEEEEDEYDDINMDDILDELDTYVDDSETWK